MFHTVPPTLLSIDAEPVLVVPPDAVSVESLDKPKLPVCILVAVAVSVAELVRSAAANVTFSADAETVAVAVSEASPLVMPLT